MDRTFYGYKALGERCYYTKTTKKDLADALGITIQGLNNKLSKRSDFYLGECILIKLLLERRGGRKITLDSLFENEDSIVKED